MDKLGVPSGALLNFIKKQKLRFNTNTPKAREIILEGKVKGRRDLGRGSVASRQGRQGRQSLGAPEWKGPPSRVLIFCVGLDAYTATDCVVVSSSSAHRCVGLRRGACAVIEQLICHHTKASDPKLSPMPKQKQLYYKLWLPLALAGLHSSMSRTQDARARNWN